MVVVFWAIICFVFLVLMMTYRYSFPILQIVALLVLLVVSLAFLGALIEPKSIYDLSRHYDLLSSIKNSTYSLKSYLLHGPNLLNSNYRYTYLFNILCFVIARHLPFQALPFIAILVSYSCLVSPAGQEALQSSVASHTAGSHVKVYNASNYGNVYSETMGEYLF